MEVDQAKNNEIEGNFEEVNGWESDDLDLSSDFNESDLIIEEGGVKYKIEDGAQGNCIPKSQYDKEKVSWENSVDDLTQRLSRSAIVIEAQKNELLTAERKMNELKNENSRLMESNKSALSSFTDDVTFKRLQNQIICLNDMLCELSEDKAQLIKDKDALKKRVNELEDLLYGPTNYYYGECKKKDETIKNVMKERDDIESQMMELKQIMRDMLKEKEESIPEKTVKDKMNEYEGRIEEMRKLLESKEKAIKENEVAILTLQNQLTTIKSEHEQDMNKHSNVRMNMIGEELRKQVESEIGEEPIQP